MAWAGFTLSVSREPGVGHLADTAWGRYLLSKSFRDEPLLVLIGKRCGGDGAGFALTIGAGADAASMRFGW